MCKLRNWTSEKLSGVSTEDLRLIPGSKGWRKEPAPDGCFLSSIFTQSSAHRQTQKEIDRETERDREEGGEGGE